MERLESGKSPPSDTKGTLSACFELMGWIVFIELVILGFAYPTWLLPPYWFTLPVLILLGISLIILLTLGIAILRQKRA
ncbi:MAG: hypothetical protein ACFFCO_04960 [Promethearchaeota archaeon]